jgi:hypothetical protein
MADASFDFDDPRPGDEGRRARRRRRVKGDRMPKIDLEKIRRQMHALKWDFTLELNGVQHRMRMPTPDILEAVRGLAAGKGDLFALAAGVVDPPAVGLDLDHALALLVTYVQTYQQWSQAIFTTLVKSDPGAAAVLAVLSPSKESLAAWPSSPVPSSGTCCSTRAASPAASPAPSPPRRRARPGIAGPILAALNAIEEAADEGRRGRRRHVVREIGNEFDNMGEAAEKAGVSVGFLSPWAWSPRTPARRSRARRVHEVPQPQHGRGDGGERRGDRGVRRRSGSPWTTCARPSRRTCFFKFVAGFKEIDNPAEKTRVAMQLLGRGGTEHPLPQPRARTHPRVREGDGGAGRRGEREPGGDRRRVRPDGDPGGGGPARDQGRGGRADPAVPGRPRPSRSAPSCSRWWTRPARASRTSTLN